MSALLRASATVGAATLASRFLGFIRDILFAAALGTGLAAEAFIVAFRLPNLFRRLTAEGALAAAFVPLFTEKLAAGGPAARRFAGQALSGLALAAILLTALAELFMPQLVHLIAGGFAGEPEKFQRAVLFSRITFPYLITISLAALYGGILNAQARFLAAALLPVLLNLILIACLLLARLVGAPGLLLSGGVALAGLLQVVMMAAACRRAAVAPNWTWPRPSPELRALFARAAPMAAAGGALQINIIVGTRIASQQDGAVSFLYYAERLYQLPLGVIGIAVGTALLPELSRRWQAGDEAAARASLNRALELAMLFTLPAAVGLALLAAPILRTLFEYGAFTAADTQASALALIGFALGLPAFVLIRVLQPGFFARGDTRTPFLYALAAIALNVAGALFLFARIGHGGIALATSAAAWLQAVLLLAHLLRRKICAPDPRLMAELWRMGLAALAMGAGLALWRAGAPDPLAQLNNLPARALDLAVLLALGLALYGLFCHILGARALGRLRDIRPRRDRP